MAAKNGCSGHAVRWRRTENPTSTWKLPAHLPSSALLQGQPTNLKVASLYIVTLAVVMYRSVIQSLSLYEEETAEIYFVCSRQQNWAPCIFFHVALSSHQSWSSDQCYLMNYLESLQWATGNVIACVDARGRKKCLLWCVWQQAAWNYWSHVRYWVFTMCYHGHIEICLFSCSHYLLFSAVTISRHGYLGCVRRFPALVFLKIPFSIWPSCSHFPGEVSLTSSMDTQPSALRR